MMTAKRIYILIGLIVLLGLLVAILGFAAYILGPPDPRGGYTAMTAKSILATNTKIQSFIYATQTAKPWTKTPTPQRTQTAAMATHHADNTRAYATATALARSTSAR
jgi:hypothetical protein